MKEALSSSATSVLTRTKRHNTPEDTILHSHRRENLRSYIEILERFQSKVLRMIVDAPWYVPSTVIGRDLQTPKIKEDIRHYSSQYSARLSIHPNDLVVNLMAQPDNRSLLRHTPSDLPTGILV
jgi:hypothetical protein